MVAACSILQPFQRTGWHVPGNTGQAESVGAAPFVWRRADELKPLGVLVQLRPVADGGEGDRTAADATKALFGPEMKSHNCSKAGLVSRFPSAPSFLPAFSSSSRKTT